MLFLVTEYYLTKLQYVYVYLWFFFPSGTSLRARTFVRNVGLGGHDSTIGFTLPEVWARSVQCVARGKPLNILVLEHT